MPMKLSRWFSHSAIVALLALPLSAYEGWMTDLEAGKARAAAEGKALVIDFTGLTWCPPCKALHAEVLTSPEFDEWSKDKILVVLDFPRARDRTAEKIAADPALAQLIALKEKFGVTGFPTLIVQDSRGTELGRMIGYQKGDGPAAYLKQLAVK